MKIYDDGYFDKYEIGMCGESLPLRRILNKLSEYENRGDRESAIKHMQYWANEAVCSGDAKSLFTIKNELMGLYRINGRREEALSAAEETLKTGEQLHLSGTEAYGTALLNAATVYKAFGLSKKALPLFRRAEEIFINNLEPNDAKTGGLYNNMALCFADLDMFDEAEHAYKKAIDIMSVNVNGQLEAAVSWLNLADLYEKREGAVNAEGKISQCLDAAEKLLEDESLPRNGYYAFVLEKCAPVFDYYGRFVYAKEKKDEAKRIYERN